jgi:hypothetical protein
LLTAWDGAKTAKELQGKMREARERRLPTLGARREEGRRL